MRKNILVVEDSPEMVELVRSALIGLEITVAETLAHAFQKISQEMFDLILLDISLPDGDGMKLLAHLNGHHQYRSCPTLILTGRTDIENKLMAFAMGADDYLIKPIEPRELLARVQSKLRKAEQDRTLAEYLDHKDVMLDIPKQKVWTNTNGEKRELDFTSIEFKILFYLMSRPDRVVTRETLLNEVWGRNTFVTDRTIDTHIGHIRKKLYGCQTEIETVIGSGYRLKV